jgi:beta-glucosidase
LAYKSDDGCRLFIDGKKVIDSWHDRYAMTDTVQINLEAGKDYHLRAEYYNNAHVAIAQLSWRIPAVNVKTRLDLYGKAGEAVRKSDLVIAVMGTNKSIEMEGKDREDISLPKDQEEFIREVYKANPNTVVVLVAGSSLAINQINKNIPAIVNAWYPGEQGGTAIADVLFGDYNPAGRLPLTYYNSLEELPPFDDYDITKGRTYQYFTGKPLYPFGYGLSYSTFEYKNLEVKEESANFRVGFSVKNTGKMDGDEVSQVYVKLPEMNIPLPIKALKGFKRVSIKKGQTEKVEISIPKESLRYWNEATKNFVVPDGKYLFMVGASSEDIRLKTEYPLFLRNPKQ